MPVATVTSATIATTLLVSSSKNDLNDKDKDLDEALTDFAKVTENYKDKKLFYAKKGEGKGNVILSEEDSKKIEELMAKGAEITDKGKRRSTVPDNLNSKPQDTNNQPVDSSEAPESSISLPKPQEDVGQKEPQKPKGLDSNEEQSEIVTESNGLPELQKKGDGLQEKNKEDSPDYAGLGGQKTLATENQDDQGTINNGEEDRNKADEQVENLQKNNEDPKLNKETSSGDSETIGKTNSNDQSKQANENETSSDGKNEDKGKTRDLAETSPSSDEDNLKQPLSNEGGDSSGNEVDLGKLQDLQNQLSNTRDALGAILKQISF